MKKLIILSIVFWAGCVCTAFSQIPPNLMATDVKIVDSVLKALGGTLKTKDYTDTGKPIIAYEIDYSFEKKQNSHGNPMVMAFFVFAVENQCTTATFMYADKSYLTKIVELLDKDDRYTRKQDSFGWESKKYNLILMSLEMILHSV